MNRANEGQRAGDHRRGHGGPAGGQVAAVHPGALNVLARRGEIDRPGPVIRVAGEAVAAVGGGDGDDIVAVVAGRVTGAGVEIVALMVAAAIARGRDDDVSMLAGVADRIGERLVVGPLRTPRMI